MVVRQYLGNTLLAYGRLIARSEGCELAVELSDHSINARMEQPDETQRAWDPNLYKRGNVFLADYANPIKPTVDHYTQLENPDQATVEDGEGSDTVDGEETDADGPHVSLITSSRYREYMRQDLISQLLNPREQWRIIAYAIIAVAILLVINIVLTAAAAGLV